MPEDLAEPATGMLREVCDVAKERCIRRSPLAATDHCLFWASEAHQLEESARGFPRPCQRELLSTRVGARRHEATP